MLNHDEFLQLNKALRTHLGIYFPESRINVLNSGLRLFMKGNSIPDIETLKQWLFEEEEISVNKIYRIANFITNGETYFFREHRVFDLLFTQIIPVLIEEYKTPIFWSAGCSTGEEPYSLAMLLLEAGLKFDRPVIFATDVNQKFLEKARKGIYSNWSFRKVSPHYIEKYFHKIDSRSYQISDEVKRLVQFSHFNLVENNWHKQLPFEKSPHLIFCRNVLIYFTQENIDRVIQNFSRVLHPAGYFISGSTEPAFRFFNNFRSVFKNGLPIYQRRTAAEVKESTRLESKPMCSLSERESRNGLTGGREKRSQEKSFSALRKISKTHSSDKQEKAAKLLSAEEIERMLIRGENQALINLLTGDTNGQNNEEKVEYLLWLARAHANIGKKKEALELCQKALEINKFNHQVYYWMGVIEMEQNNTDKAKAYFQKSIYLQPDYAMPYIMLAHLSGMPTQSGNAQKHLKTALNILEKRPPEEIVYEADGSTVEALIKNLKMTMS
ncbi:MAG: hypothetical protein Kow0037_21850 [Calditrichia bacterium]